MRGGRCMALFQGVALVGMLLPCACGGGGHSGETKPVDPVQTGCAPAPSSSLTVNVRDAPYSAKGDGITDDTAAIQAAVNAVGGTGGTVSVPDGTYLINALAVASGGSHGIGLKGNMTLRLSPGATLKAIPNAASSYAILFVGGVSNVNIIGGTVEGERSAHTGSGGESGMGVTILSSNHVVVEGVTAKECWGDGFYVGGTLGCQNVTLCGVTSDHNRRQGLSITFADGVLVRNATFKNTTGTLPEAGIDIEPNSGETVNQVQISGCTFTNNAGGGFQSGVPVALTGLAFTTNILFDGNTVSANGVNPIAGGTPRAIYISNCDGTRVTNNTVRDNTGEGILLTQNATHTLLSGNTVTGTRSVAGFDYWSGGGVYLASCAHSTVINNTVTGNSGFGIVQPTVDPTLTLSGNTVSGNGKTP